MKYHLGLGTNLGRTIRNLDKTVFLLIKKGIEIQKMSSIYKTEPVGLADQPCFINQVVEAESDLAPREMLEAIKGIEKIMKRRQAVRNGPRIIDIDILLAEDAVVRTEDLVIPHPRLADRNFVLVPLAEIAPDVVHPILKKSMKELARLSRDRSRVQKIR